VSLFQTAGLVLSLAIAWLLAHAVVRGRARLRAALPWMALWLAAAVAFAWPESTGIVARRLGVDRGADLISYLSVLAMLLGFLWVSVRLRGLNRQITLVVRALALAEADRSDGAATGAGGSTTPSVGSRGEP
jgi:hypothetical protein